MSYFLRDNLDNNLLVCLNDFFGNILCLLEFGGLDLFVLTYIVTRNTCVLIVAVLLYIALLMYYMYVYFLLCCYSLHISMPFSMYPWIYLCFLVYLVHLSSYLMYMFILLVYGYELMCVCAPVYLLLFRFTLPRGVIRFIAPELIWISIYLSCSSFHNTLFILYPV